MTLEAVVTKMMWGLAQSLAPISTLLPFFVLPITVLTFPASKTACPFLLFLSYQYKKGYNSAYRKIENGSTGLTLEKVRVLYEKLNIDPTYLLAGGGYYWQYNLRSYTASPPDLDAPQAYPSTRTLHNSFPAQCPPSCSPALPSF